MSSREVATSSNTTSSSRRVNNLQCKRKRVSAEVPESQSDLAPFSRRSPPPRPERRAPTHARARGAAPARRRRQVDQCTVHRLKWAQTYVAPFRSKAATTCRSQTTRELYRPGGRRAGSQRRRAGGVSPALAQALAPCWGVMYLMFGSYGYGFFEEEARRRVVRVRVLRTSVGLRQLVLLF